MKLLFLITAFAVLLQGRSGTMAAHRAVDQLLRAGGEDDFCFYDAYFVSRLSGQGFPALRNRHVDAHRGLTETQVRSGEHRGSWEASDRWSAVGGRLYATALATLALQTAPVSY